MGRVKKSIVQGHNLYQKINFTHETKAKTTLIWKSAAILINSEEIRTKRHVNHHNVDILHGQQRYFNESAWYKHNFQEDRSTLKSLAIFPCYFLNYTEIHCGYALALSRFKSHCAFLYFLSHNINATMTEIRGR